MRAVSFLLERLDRFLDRYGSLLHLIRKPVELLGDGVADKAIAMPGAL